MTKIANVPEPPCYAVIFSSHRTEGDKGDAEMASSDYCRLLFFPPQCPDRMFSEPLFQKRHKRPHPRWH